MGLADVRGWLAGRSGRGEFWLSILGLVILNVILNLTVGNPAVTSLISTPFWLVIAARRLHDFGRTGWWGLIPFVVGFVVGFAGGAGVHIPSTTALGINALTALAMIGTIGAIPGAKGPNRFGERPA